MTARVLIVGAGAAGLMAAIHAARSGAQVTVLERTADGGRKILISGGGRCNVLPSEAADRRFVTDSSRHTLTRLLGSWPLDAQRQFFEQTLGIQLALEPETGKLFPASDRAREVRDRLVAEARSAGATFRFGAVLRNLIPGASGWLAELEGGTALTVDRVILATGGLSVPQTGSDGIGLALVERLGHRMVPTYPALTPLTAVPPVHAELAGVSRRVRIEATWGSETAESDGGFLFTHRGYSGPAALDVSHLAVRSRLLGKSDAVLRVRWTGADPAAWDERLRTQSRQAVATVLRLELPDRLATRLLQVAGVPPDRTLAQLSREERRAVVQVVADYPLPWTGDEGYKKAEVTGGGVGLGEVHPATMESRRAAGLFLCGEILDAFGPIGGYNFSWAWATGRLAGLGAASRA
ncbi:MAG: BaiN/RdsA family NAD(P)/FAD-dependent oxidoreductase [Gemmatimonadales bacterium]